MVTPVDNITLQILGAIGISLPLFILIVDTFAEDNDYASGLVLVSIAILVTSACVALVSLLLHPSKKGDKNLLLDLSTSLLAVGYFGLGWSVYNIMDIDCSQIGWKGTILAVIAVGVASIVFLLNTTL